MLGGVKPPPHPRGFVRGVQVAPPGSPPAPRCREAPPPAGGSAASPQAARGLEGGGCGGAGWFWGAEGKDTAGLSSVRTKK